MRLHVAGHYWHYSEPRRIAWEGGEVDGLCIVAPRREIRVSRKLRGRRKAETQLHELAHAYHDRVLGFAYGPIRKAWDKIVASKKYEKVLHIRGRQVRHYALTNHKEFFAEMSEAFFDANDFYPFVRAELRDFEPEVFALLKAVWSEGEPPKPKTPIDDDFDIYA